MAIASALLSLGILVVGTVTDVTLPAIALASGALLCVLLRLVMTFRAHQTMLRRTTREALTDPLTGLGNRRAFAAALSDRLDDDDPEPLVLVLFDLDGFKSYNDTFGHAAGDALLQRMATGLQAAIGADAAAYRMGGDEFCALLPGGADGADQPARPVPHLTVVPTAADEPPTGEHEATLTATATGDDGPEVSRPAPAVSCVVPASAACMAGPPPANGTCVMLIFALSLSCSMVRCGIEPGPPVP